MRSSESLRLLLGGAYGDSRVEGLKVDVNNALGLWNHLPGIDELSSTCKRKGYGINANEPESDKVDAFG